MLFEMQSWLKDTLACIRYLPDLVKEGVGRLLCVDFSKVTFFDYHNRSLFAGVSTFAQPICTSTVLALCLHWIWILNRASRTTHDTIHNHRLPLRIITSNGTNHIH